MKKFLLYVAVFASLQLSSSAQTILLQEDFENGMPAQWTTQQASGSTGWQVGTASALSSQYWTIPTVPGKIAASNDDACNCDMSVDYLITDTLDLSGVSSAVLTFDAYIDGAYGSTGHIKISTDLGNTWTNVFDVPASDKWETYNVDLSSYIGNNNVLINFHHNDNGQWATGFAVDNVIVKELPANDIAITDLTFPAFAVTTTSTNISGTITNLGSQTLTSFDLSWNDGSGAHTETVSGISVPTLGTYNFTSSTPFNQTALAEYNITVTVSNPNGSTDADASNNSKESSITTLAFAPEKRVVGEEGTGTWCGWCPRGAVYMDSLAYLFPETWVGIAVHNGDPMVVSDYDNGMGNLIGGYPSGLVDRHYNDVDPSEFKQYYLKRIELTPEASVALRNINFDSQTREITFDVEVAFATNISNPDYRFNAVIVEDSVTGTSSGYDQANYYSSQANNIDLVGVDGVNWKDLPNPVPAAQMVYNHVARAILGGFSGSIQDTLPSSIEVGVPYTRSYSYTLPSGYNENHIKVVGLLLNNATGEIVNAYETSLLSPTYPSGVFVKDLAEDNFNIYPNPNNGNFILSAKNLTGNERLVVFNTLGEVVFSENITASFSEVSLKNAHPGIYFVKIISDQGNIVRKIVVQ